MCYSGIDNVIGSSAISNKEIEIFYYKDSLQVRAFIDGDNEKWFCHKDVCDILRIIDHTRSLENLSKNGVVGLTHILTDGESRNAIFINEGKLFRLITGSRKREAKVFTDWICDVVLPALNRKGRYRIGEENEPKQPWSPAESLRQLVDFMESFNSRIETMEREISELKEAFNKVHNNDMTKKELYTVSGFAKCHDISINFKQSGELGKKAIKYCNNNGLSVSRKPVSPDTFINSYPYDALKAVFEDYFDINL